MSEQGQPTLFLHVGAPKCASTTLQAAFAKYRGGAMTFPEAAAHSISVKAGAHWLETLREYIEPAVVSANWLHRDCILSHESFYSNFERVYPVLRELFPEHLLRVLIVERDVKNQVRSTLAQWVWTCMHIPSSRQQLDHYRRIGPEAFESSIRTRQQTARMQWVGVADSHVVGDVSDVSQLASEWLDDSMIIEGICKVGRKNISLSGATVAKMLAELDNFRGTPEEWRAFARKLEG